MTSSVWRPGDEWRPLLGKETQLLDALTALDFAGATELRAQIPFTTAQQGCGCGCGTINLKVDRSRAAPADVARNPVPGEANVRSAEAAALSDGDIGGGLLLFARDGYLSCLEIHTWLDEPMQLPDVSDIQPYVAPPPEPPLPRP